MLPTFKVGLHNIDADEIDDVLRKIERSFGFQFGEGELSHVKTFGELCDVIVNKVRGIESVDCTGQQAFYKIRSAISRTTGLSPNTIDPGTKLKDIYPQHLRRQQVKALQAELNVKLDILDIRNWLGYTITLGATISFLLFFINWQAAVAGLSFFILLGYISYKFFAKEFKIETVSDLTGKFKREHYMLSRRNPGTVKRTEILQTVKELFKADMDLEDSVFHRDTVMVF